MEMSMILIDIGLFRSWCLQLPEATHEVSGKEEYFKVHNNTFAMIASNGIRIKCTPDNFKKAIQHPDISASKQYGQFHWIWIHSCQNLYIEDFHEYIINSYEIVVKNLSSKKIQKKLLEKLSHELDLPWKDVSSVLFEDFLALLVPDTASDIDWSKSPVFLDKELSQITKGSKTGKRIVDKLAQVYRLSGEKKWVLCHFEIQAQEQSGLPERMLTYSNRLEDIHKMLVASFAILADDNPNWRPTTYNNEIWGTRKTFEFPIIKLLDFKDRWDDLEKSDNPFAIVVMAHLKMLETKKDYQKRFEWKVELTKMLYEKQYPQEKVYAIFRFIDWIMMLPRDLARSYQQIIHQIEEEKK